MKIPCLSVLACVFPLFPGVALSATTEPGLPSWNEGELAGLQASSWVAGGLLLTEEPVPDSADSKPAPLDVEQPTAEVIAESATPPNEIPEKFWPAYFDARPETFLLDPQGVLSPVDYRNRLGFLNYHAGDSLIDLYVYVFKGDQDIPGELRDEELIERFFSKGRPAAVVYYYMGAPQRSVLHLSPSLTDVVPAAEQRRALESSIMQAFEKVDSAAQIEAFLVQMSIRLYWMERMMGGEGASASASLPVAGSAHSAGSSVKSASLSGKLSGKLQPWIGSVERFAWPTAIVGVALVMIFATTAWMRKRARYQFPDFEVEPRLGGDFAAGVGAVISFASAALPPASQRDQVPDYLRRA